MPIDPRVTLVIPTQNRHETLTELLDFLEEEGTKFQTVILDSSATDYHQRIPSRHLACNRLSWIRSESSRLPTAKISAGLSTVNSRYAVLCADDDYLFPSAVAECADFLDTHPDYALAHGKYIYVHGVRAARDQKHPCRWEPLYGSHTSIDSEDPLTRLLTQLENYNGTTFYALHRTDALIHSFHETAASTSDWGLTEVVPCSLSLLMGKLKVINRLYAARIAHESLQGGPIGSTPEKWFEREKLDRACKCIIDNLAQLKPTSAQDNGRIAGALKKYAVANIQDWHVRQQVPPRFLKYRLRRILSALGLLDITQILRYLLTGGEKPGVILMRDYQKLMTGPSGVSLRRLMERLQKTRGTTKGEHVTN